MTARSNIHIPLVVSAVLILAHSASADVFNRHRRQPTETRCLLDGEDNGRFYGIGSQRCQNDGECIRIGLSITCRCLKEFYGPFCENRRNCTKFPCANGGLCCTSSHPSQLYSQPVLFSCDCQGTGYTGANCQIPITCSADLCNNAGTCGIDYHTNVATCTCRYGYSGDACEQSIQQMSNGDQSPCDPALNPQCDQNSNGGLPIYNSAVAPNTYVIIQQQGQQHKFYPAPLGNYRIQSPNYQQKVFKNSFKIKCVPNPCRNRGVCLPDGSCKCAVGFEGPQCEDETCNGIANPCNGGICYTEYVHAYGARKIACDCEGRSDHALCLLPSNFSTNSFTMRSGELPTNSFITDLIATATVATKPTTTMQAMLITGAVSANVPRQQIVTDTRTTDPVMTMKQTRQTFEKPTILPAQYSGRRMTNPWWSEPSTPIMVRQRTTLPINPVPPDPRIGLTSAQYIDPVQVGPTRPMNSAPIVPDNPGAGASTRGPNGIQQGETNPVALDAVETDLNSQERFGIQPDY